MKSVILVENGVQDEEFIYPYYRLHEEGVVEVAGRTLAEMRGKYGIPIRPTMQIADLDSQSFDCVIIPGGWECPEKLRQNDHVLHFLQAMDQDKKIIAAICHGPWVLVSAKLCNGRKMTCYQGMRDDLQNAGATYVETGVVVDRNIVTSPHYRNNPEFMQRTIKLIREMGRLVDYSNVVVTKPWGHEFLITQNADVGLWYLHIKGGCSTSFHSHPNKKTGLVILAGKADIAFMNGHQTLKPGDKIMIRSGVFHSITNHNTEPIELLEVETPNDKSDIVRLMDNYGRSGTPYEDSAHHVPIDEKWNLNVGHTVTNLVVRQVVFQDHNELLDLPECKIIMLSGKLRSKGYDILTPGDVVDNVAITRLATKFDAVLPITAIRISKE